MRDRSPWTFVPTAYLLQGIPYFLVTEASVVLYKRLGMVYRAKGDQGAARQAFRKYLEMEPDAPDKAEFQPFL